MNTFTEIQFTISPFKNISERSIEEHKKLYAGYVKNANAVLEKIDAYKGDESKAYELGELYRHFAFEYNGMRNHECYFTLLSGAQAVPEDAPLILSIKNHFGSIEHFKSAFTELALTRGVGWAMLSWDKAANALLMHWVDEQHLGQLQGTIPIIALDMWEHSYVADYQPSGKKQYVLDFLESVNWSAAQANFANAIA
jgi:Fe-Mn family superoxide dismutase